MVTICLSDRVPQQYDSQSGVISVEVFKDEQNCVCSFYVKGTGLDTTKDLNILL